MRVFSVLAAVTGEPCDDDVIKLACELLDSRKGKLHILYVIEVERALPVDAEITPATAKGEEVLKHGEQIARAYKCKPDAELVQAREMGSAVVREAVDKKADAIVLGSQYMERHGSFYLGDTIPYVLKNAPCRVIVCRAPAVDVSANGQSN